METDNVFLRRASGADSKDAKYVFDVHRNETIPTRFQCDGVHPCCRCKKADTVCEYGNYKKSNRVLYQMGYVLGHCCLHSP